MNQLERLAEDLRRDYPAAKIAVDAPDMQTGSWFMDICEANRLVTVEWRPGHGFGLCYKEGGGYGEGPDEIVETALDAFDRIRGMLKQHVKPSKKVVQAAR